MTAEELIKILCLQKHPEGGYFREVYRSDEIIDKNALSERFNGSRNISTSIYFLLKSGDKSDFHRIKSDEIWHFYSGSSLTIYIINKEGNLNKVKLGCDPSNDELFQYTVPKECWFAAEVNEQDSYALVGWHC